MGFCLFFFFVFLVFLMFLFFSFLVLVLRRIIIGRLVLTLLRFFFLLLFHGCRLFQFQSQFGLTELHQRCYVLLFRFTTCATHIQNNVFIGIDFNEIATLERQVTGVATFFTRRSSRGLLGETRKFGLHLGFDDVRNR